MESGHQSDQELYSIWLKYDPVDLCNTAIQSFAKDNLDNPFYRWTFQVPQSIACYKILIKIGGTGAHATYLINSAVEAWFKAILCDFFIFPLEQNSIPLKSLSWKYYISELCRTCAQCVTDFNMFIFKRRCWSDWGHVSLWTLYRIAQCHEFRNRYL